MCPNNCDASANRRPRSASTCFKGPPHEITQRVLDGQADIAITAPRPKAPGLAWRRLYVDQLCLAVPRGHRLAGRARVRLSAAAGEPFVALGEQAGLRQLTDQLCAEDGIDPDIVFEATEIPTVEGLVAAGFGVAVVPVPRDGGKSKIVHVPLTNAGAKREVGLVWDRHRILPPPAERFADFLSNDASRRIDHHVKLCIGHIRAASLTVPCHDHPTVCPTRCGQDTAAVRPHTAGCSPRFSAREWRRSPSSTRRRPSSR